MKKLSFFHTPFLWHFTLRKILFYSLMETRNTSSKTDFIPLRTILLYQRSFLMMPNVPSAWIDLFILRSAPWILSRFSITSWCIAVSSRLLRRGIKSVLLEVFLVSIGHRLRFQGRWTGWRCRSEKNGK